VKNKNSLKNLAGRRFTRSRGERNDQKLQKYTDGGTVGGSPADAKIWEYQ